MNTFDTNLAHLLSYFTIADNFGKLIDKFVDISTQVPNNGLLPISSLLVFSVNWKVVFVSACDLERNLNVGIDAKWLIDMEVVVLFEDMITRICFSCFAFSLSFLILFLFNLKT